MADRRPLALAAIPALCLATLLATGGSSSCGGGGEPAPPKRTTLEVMYFMEDLRRKIEPNVRNTAALDDLATWSEQLAEWSRDPAVAGFVDSARFRSDPSLYAGYHDELRSAVDELAAAAEARDLDRFLEAWKLVNMSMIRCHKRFQPNY